MVAGEGLWVLLRRGMRAGVGVGVGVRGRLGLGLGRVLA